MDMAEDPRCPLSDVSQGQQRIASFCRSSIDIHLVFQSTGILFINGKRPCNNERCLAAPRNGIYTSKTTVRVRVKNNKGKSPWLFT